MPVSSLVASTTGRLTLTCLVDRDSSVSKNSAVQPLNGGSCGLFVTHLDKAKAFASPCVTISDDRGLGHLSDLFEKIAQIVFSRLIGKSPYIQSHVAMLLCRHLLIY